MEGLWIVVLVGLVLPSLAYIGIAFYIARYVSRKKGANAFGLVILAPLAVILWHLVVGKPVGRWWEMEFLAPTILASIPLLFGVLAGIPNKSEEGQ
jgi:predicted small integral membrane protein